MESDEACFSISCILKSCFRKLRVAWIYVVCNQVVQRSRYNHILRNLRRNKHDICSHEIRHILKSKSGLKSNVSSTDVFIHVQCVHPERHTSCSSLHFLELVHNFSDRHSNSHLPGGFVPYKRACFQLRVEFSSYHIDQIRLEFIIRGLNCSIIAFFCNRLQRYSLSVLFDADCIERHFFHLVLRQRNFISFRYRTALQCSGNLFGL